MAEDRSKVAAGISVTAAIGAALAWINSRKVGAARGEIVLPDEFVQLIIAIAASAGTVDASIQKVIQELTKLSINVQGFPANTRGIRTFSIVCAVANRGYQGADMQVPEGMSLLIKSYPTNAIGSLVRVGSSQSEATNLNSSWPLMPNEAVGYAVQDANEMYVSATVAGLLVVFSVEKAKYKVQE